MEQFPVRLPKLGADRAMIGHDKFKPVEAVDELKAILKPALEKAQLLEPTFNQETLSLDGLIAVVEKSLKREGLLNAEHWLNPKGEDTRARIKELVARLNGFLELNGIKPKND